MLGPRRLARFPRLAPLAPLALSSILLLAPSPAARAEDMDLEQRLETADRDALTEQERTPAGDSQSFVSW